MAENLVVDFKYPKMEWSRTCRKTIARKIVSVNEPRRIILSYIHFDISQIEKPIHPNWIIVYTSHEQPGPIRHGCINVSKIPLAFLRLKLWFKRKFTCHFVLVYFLHGGFRKLIEQEPERYLKKNTYRKFGDNRWHIISVFLNIRLVSRTDIQSHKVCHNPSILNQI